MVCALYLYAVNFIQVVIKVIIKPDYLPIFAKVRYHQVVSVLLVSSVSPSR